MIRLAESRDASRLAAIFAPYVEGTAITFSTEPPTAEGFVKKLEMLGTNFPFLVYEENGRVEAYAYASPHRSLAAYRWCVEVSVYASQDSQRRGHGSRLYASLLPLLRRQNFQNVYAGITLPNAASVRLHEKFGFRSFAVFRDIGFKAGAWRDVGWWELALQEKRSIPPEEPLALSELSGPLHGGITDRFSRRD